MSASKPSSNPAKQGAGRLFIGIGLVAISFLVYGASLRVPLLFDDHPAIERNATIRQLWPLTDVLLPPTSGAGATGRPLVNLSLALNYAWGGLDVTGYHLFNVLVHALATLVLWGLVRRTLRNFVPAYSDASRAEAIAAWSALLWALHPLNTEAVVCIVQRNELLAGLFYLLTLYAFALSLQGTSPNRWRVAAFAACLAGVLSKEVVATAPLVVLLYDRTFGADSWREVWRRRGRFHLVLVATWLPLAWLMFGTHGRAGTVGFGLGMSAWSYLLTQCRALVIYLKLSVCPYPLVLDYGAEVVSGPGEVWSQAIVIIGLLGVTIWALWRRPLGGFLGAVFFLILAPSSSIVPLTTQTIAEHRMYLPLAALMVLAVVASERLAWRGFLRGAVAVGLGTLTYFRTLDYSSEAKIWRDTVNHAPGNARAHSSLGHVWALEKRWNEAAESYATAVRLRPDYADAQNDYANVLAQLGRKIEALAHYEAAWRLKPDDLDIGFNFGRALVAEGRMAEGIDRLTKVVRSDPTRFAAWLAIGEANSLIGQKEAAAAALTRAVQLRPDVAELQYNLGNVELELNRLPAAVSALAEAVRLQPTWPAARNNLALALVRAGRPADAVSHYEAALRVEPNNAQVHQNLALALGQLGRVEEAIVHDEAVLRLDPANREARDHLLRLRRR